MIKASMPGPEQASAIAETSAFKNCSSTTLERIYSEGNLVLFSVGQALKYFQLSRTEFLLFSRELYD